MSERVRVRVLIVDDHPAFADALKVLLERDPSLEVVGVAGDGAEAVDLAVAEDAEVVLMDIGLPKVDGFEACRRLLRIKKAARVIAVSGRSKEEIGAEAQAAGMVSYLSKNFIHEHVHEAIERARRHPTAASWDSA